MHVGNMAYHKLSVIDACFTKKELQAGAILIPFFKA